MVMFALGLSLFAAGLFIGFGVYNELVTVDPPVDNFEQQMLSFISVAFGLGSTALIGLYSIGLILSAILLAELLRWQSLIANLVLGGGIAFALSVLHFGNSLDALAGNNALMVSLSAGFIAGFIYWLLAGRNAGNWLGARSRT